MIFQRSRHVRKSWEDISFWSPNRHFRLQVSRSLKANPTGLQITLSCWCNSQVTHLNVEGKFAKPRRPVDQSGGESWSWTKWPPKQKVARKWESSKRPPISRVSQITNLRNPVNSPVDMVNIPLFIHYLQDFIHPKWLEMGFLNHQLRRMSKD